MKVDCWYIKGGVDEQEHREFALSHLNRVSQELRGEPVRFSSAKELGNAMVKSGWKNLSHIIPLMALVSRDGEVISVSS